MIACSLVKTITASDVLRTLSLFMNAIYKLQISSEEAYLAVQQL